MLTKLYEKEILSLIVEGGYQLLKSFIESGLWDEAYVFTGPKYFQEGVPAPKLPLTPLSEEIIGQDKLEIYLNAAISRSF